ncbi:MAG: deoxyribodipyrimidine photo-lyase [Anaerolineales bacterium]|nr:deoxyribodipyrimidine photo-lyase [Anaerolineales bacterium]
MTSIWWIRRDLRLTDNPTLHSALVTGDVLPVFIIDPAFSSQSPRRKNFLYEGLSSLHKNLQTRGSYLIIRSGKPVDVLRQLIQETNATTIFAEEDYTPYARKRDSLVASQLPLQLILGQTVHHPEFVKKADGTPYTIYTPYSKVWKSLLQEIKLIPAPKTINTPANIFSEPLPEFVSNPLFPAGEKEALRRLNQFTNSQSTNSPIYQYAEARNRMDLDGTSSLSPYLRFGMLGLRQAVRTAQQAQGQGRSAEEKHGAEIWLNELIWREFYIQILYQFPRVRQNAFNASLANIQWRNNETEFSAWKNGLTGMPIVDAAMRQLKETGWMHNRARMIVASFLVKDLLIDWRWGEAWFMENLLDGDLAANNGGWQWTAGTGTDAAPYFRIFNPILQSAKFDPDGNYIRKWVPELRGLNAKEIHAPWEKEIKVNGYPEKPIVDRGLVKERTMNAYNLSKEKTQNERK